MKANRSYKRGEYYRDASLVVIIGEGNKEERYFSAFREIIRTQRVKIEVLGTEENKSAPNFVEERINKAKEEYLLDEGDIIWLVFDKDQWEEHILFGIPATLDKKYSFDIKLAVSNPCFEVWLMLSYFFGIRRKLSERKKLQGTETFIPRTNRRFRYFPT